MICTVLEISATIVYCYQRHSLLQDDKAWVFHKNSWLSKGQLFIPTRYISTSVFLQIRCLWINALNVERLYCIYFYQRPRKKVSVMLDFLCFMTQECYLFNFLPNFLGPAVCTIHSFRIHFILHDQGLISMSKLSFHYSNEQAFNIF